ncbi:unnamed protein product [Closterium sp. Naga37s-1]|nr:unnamed protein product [Closterium sp. Naga37s-1]
MGLAEAIEHVLELRGSLRGCSKTPCNAPFPPNHPLIPDPSSSAPACCFPAPLAPTRTVTPQSLSFTYPLSPYASICLYPPPIPLSPPFPLTHPPSSYPLPLPVPISAFPSAVTRPATSPRQVHAVTSEWLGLRWAGITTGVQPADACAAPHLAGMITDALPLSVGALIAKALSLHMSPLSTTRPSQWSNPPILHQPPALPPPSRSWGGPKLEQLLSLRSWRLSPTPRFAAHLLPPNPTSAPTDSCPSNCDEIDGLMVRLVGLGASGSAVRHASEVSQKPVCSSSGGMRSSKAVVPLSPVCGSTAVSDGLLTLNLSPPGSVYRYLSHLWPFSRAFLLLPMVHSHIMRMAHKCPGDPPPHGAVAIDEHPSLYTCLHILPFPGLSGG